MGAPGDSLLIFALLAVFLGCVGYGAGRLHQRWQAAQDYEDAYRDGYENGTRNVFSSAVRMLGPKRAVRATVAPAEKAVPPTKATPPKKATPPEKVVPPEKVASAAPPVKATQPDKADENTSAAQRKLGFPLPPPPPRDTVPEPTAVGGLTFRPFPNPRRAEPVEETPPAAVPRPRPADRSGLGLGTHPRNERDHTTDEQPTGGRHTVPDELVRATTYRLPADRVFRARVPKQPRLPDEPTRRLSPPQAGPEK